MSLVSMEQIKFKELSAAVKVLNESGCLKTAILTVGKTKEDIVNAFVKGVQETPDDENGNWTGPEATAAYYNTIMLPDEPEKKPEAKEKKKKGEEPEKKKSEAPAKKNRLVVTGEVLTSLLEKGPIKQAVFIETANQAYAKESGSVNEKEATWAAKVAISVLSGFGAIKVSEDEISKA